MHVTTYPPQPSVHAAPRSSLTDRLGLALAGIRDWLDERGRLAWIAAMVLGFVAFWPLGLFILGYMIWSKRMFGACQHRRHNRDSAMMAQFRRAGFAAGTGNTAFDAYREETLRRLEDEHEEFLSFLARLREAKDKAEFDQFMQQRRETPVQPE